MKKTVWRGENLDEEKKELHTSMLVEDIIGVHLLSEDLYYKLQSFHRAFFAVTFANLYFLGILPA